MRLLWLEAPHHPSRALQLLLPPRHLLGRPVRDVVPQAPLKHGNAGGTSTAAGCDATPNDRCGARFGVWLPRAVSCGLAAPTPLLTTTSTTRTTTRCFCSASPRHLQHNPAGLLTTTLCSTLGWRIWLETRSLSHREGACGLTWFFAEHVPHLEGPEEQHEWTCTRPSRATWRDSREGFCGASLFFADGRLAMLAGRDSF